MNPIQQAIEVLAKITERDRHRGLVQLDVEDFVEIDAALTSLRSLNKEVEEVELPPLPEPHTELYKDLTPVLYEAWSQQLHAYARTAIAAALGREGPGSAAWKNSEGWESLAWELCADENGEDSCNELIWEGGPIPEPWGERWLKYEDEAKRLIALVQKHVRPAAPTPEATQPTQAEAAGERELLSTAHAQIRHLIDDLTLTIEDDGFVRYLPVCNLVYSNLIAALIELAPKLSAALATQQAEPEVPKAVLQAIR